MPTYDMTGTVKVVMDQQTFDSGFTKREFVITTEDDRYPQDIKFECVKDKVSLLDDVKEGQNVTVKFDLRGNEHNGRYFVNLTAWRLASDNVASSSSAEGPPLDQPQPTGEETDRIPF